MIPENPTQQRNTQPTPPQPAKSMWQTLPLRARQQATELLVLMLRAAADRQRGAAVKEVGHER